MSSFLFLFLETFVFLSKRRKKLIFSSRFWIMQFFLLLPPPTFSFYCARKASQCRRDFPPSSSLLCCCKFFATFLSLLSITPPRKTTQAKRKLFRSSTENTRKIAFENSSPFCAFSSNRVKKPKVSFDPTWNQFSCISDLYPFLSSP